MSFYSLQAKGLTVCETRKLYGLFLCEGSKYRHSQIKKRRKPEFLCQIVESGQAGETSGQQSLEASRKGSQRAAQLPPP